MSNATSGGFTREQLIGLCEQARCPEERWSDRDSASAQRQLGEAWALLSAGCTFLVLPNRGRPEPHSSHLVTDEQTIWVSIESKGFNYFEGDSDGLGPLDEDSFYLPTDARLSAADGEDWYS